jgi:HD-GYP domain-containing protein (c-di-GMP phosphodiesterase class II)
MLSISEQIAKLARIGAALTSEHDLNKLLDLIVREARALTNADAGSLYIKEGDYLQFVVSQNETLERRFRDRGQVMEKFKPFPVEISNQSISGYVANNSEALNIPNVREIPENTPYSWNPSFDEKNDYRTVSMLSVPMIDQQDSVIGVLQLINARCWPDEDGGPCGEVVPFDDVQVDLVQSLASQAAVAITNARLTASLKDAYLDTIYRLSVAAEYKDLDTALHIKRMSLYSKILAAAAGMGEREVELVLYSSPMHDVGKLGVPDAILLKPGRLDPDERKVMENHTIYGAKILEGSDSEVLEWSRVIALSHHEKWDGSGYPNKIKGEDIPVTGRIVAIADVFDALTSIRPYKKAWTFDDAVDTIRKDAGTHFDPGLVQVFDKYLDEIHEVYKEHQEYES